MNTLQKYEKYLYLIILIGIVIYSPIFFNGFVWDDYPFIINNPQVHQFNILQLFASNTFNDGPFYRPIPAVYFALVYSLFGLKAFFYHILQLFLHTVGAFLLFIFLCTFFSEYIALFLTLIFLVHPINVESVAYIGSTQSELYFIPGIAALLLAQKKHLSGRKFYLILFFLLLSTLTKEVGFLFFVLVIAYRIIYRLGNIKKFTLSAGLMLFFYLSLRIFYGGVTYSMDTSIPIASLSLPQRLINIPSIILYYINTFMFPLTLSIWQDWIIKKIGLYSLIYPLLLCVLLFGILSYIGYIFFKKRNKNKEYKQYFQTYLFFFIWFIITMGPLLQIIPLDMTVADRWFYFPIVGLLGMIGTIIRVWLPSYKLYKKQYLLVAIVILSLLSIRTFTRTFNYKSELILYKHDLQTNHSNYMLLNNYGEDLIHSGKEDEGCKFIQGSVELIPNAPALRELGSCNYDKHDYDNALVAYKQALLFSKGDQSKYIPMTQNRIMMTLEAHGEELVNEGLLTEGCTYLQQAASFDPTASTINELGNCYQLNQQYNEAIKAYSKSLQLVQGKAVNTSTLPIYLNLAHVYILDNHAKEAIDLIKKEALPKYPGNTTLINLLNIAESEANEFNSPYQDTAPITLPFEQTGSGIPPSLQQISAPM